MTRYAARYLYFFSLLLACLACNFSTAPPATLQVQSTAPTSVPPALQTPTGSVAAESVSRPVDASVNQLFELVQNDRLMMTVRSLVDMNTRHVLSKKSDTVGGIEGARDWLLAQFKAIRDANPRQPIQVWTQTVVFDWKGISVAPQNVIAVLQGTDVGAGVIVVGAHYDSITTDFANGEAYAPGANDNASGVAAMLEVARILAPLPRRATILFVAFAAEESGRQGSLAFVKSYLQAQEPPIDLRAMINLDMIGSEMGKNGEVDHRTIRLFSADPNDSPSRQLARQLGLIIGTYLDDVDAVIQSAEERNGRWGDHQSFSAAGYPSVRFIQGLEDTARQHTPRDTIDNVQPGFLMKTTRATLISTLILASGPIPPRDIALRISAADPSIETLVWTPAPQAVKYLVVLRRTSSLFYDKILTIEASALPELVISDLSQYATIAVAAVDSAGRMGPLTPEISIATLRK
jgi:hypothetical protein